MTTDPKQLSANKQALLKIRELKQQLAEAQSGANQNEPIAVVSMACRFPRHAKTPELFWKSLIDQTDEVTDIPDDRWDMDAFHDDDPEVPGKMYARRGVFLDDIDLMDPEFFGISPREATWIDPQQRLLLEVGWEAIERAAWTPEKIGEQTGIFVGWMHNDYQNEASDSFLNLNPYIATGAAGSFLCGRLAYYLGLQGPSVAVDTACSSSLVALHLAIQSLQRRDCDRALVGGVNAIASPTTNILTCKLKALSPTGQSRAFDAAADGYLRGEGCGVVTLRRLTDAKADGDPIIGVIRGSAVGHNGFSSGLTAPNPKAQEKVIRQAVERAGISPTDIGYLEAHGTGTELGDPIEMQAAAAALTENRTSENPLLVGSVKTNIGHLEAAAGMAGLIKVLLSIQKNKIPGQLNFETPNPHIPWDKIPVNVLTEPTDWPNVERRIAGVSAFGMSGTNAHVVVEAPSQPSNPNVKNKTGTSKTNQTSHLITLSGKSSEAIQTLAEEYLQNLEQSAPESAITSERQGVSRRSVAQPSPTLEDIAFTTTVGRSHFEHRAAIVAETKTDLLESLKTIARGATSETTFTGSSGRRSPKVAWQFTGQGSQYLGMARGLYESQPVFRKAIEHCDELIRQSRGESLLDVLLGDDSRIDHTSWTQPAIFAVQMGLCKLLQSYGHSPDVVWGHSVGQFAAACVAGIMSWDDGLKLISERGRQIGDLPSGGKMLAVFLSPADVRTEIENVPEVSVAAINGTHVVISGPENSIKQIENRLSDRSVRVKALTTSHAFHSSLMDPVLEPFANFADEVQFNPPQIPLICNVSGKVLKPDALLDGKYWASHIRQAVQFSPTIQAAEELGCQLILEIGPQSVLTRMAAANWTRPTGSLISCLQKDADDSQSLLRALGQLYVHGCSPDFEALHSGGSGQSVLLPTYPFQRRRFWGPDKPRAFHAQYHTAHPLLGSAVSLAGVGDQKRFESFVDVDSPSWLPDHEVMNNIVLPGAAYVEMAIAAAGADQIESIQFEQPLRLESRTALQTVIGKSDDQKTIETYSSPANTNQWTRNFSARLVVSTEGRPKRIDRATLESALSETESPADFYQKMSELGLNYGPEFQTIQSFRFSKTEVVTQLKANSDTRGFTVSPTLLDGALHSLAVGLVRQDDGNLFLPVAIGRVRCFQAVENEAWCHAKWTQNEGANRSADLVLFDNDGNVAVEITDLKVQQVSVAALRQMSGTGAERLIYDLNWERVRLPAGNTRDRNWLVVSNAKDELGKSLSNQLRESGNHSIEVRLETGEPFERIGETAFSFCGSNAENWNQIFQALSTDEVPFQPQGISWLIGDGPATESTMNSILSLNSILDQRDLREIECGWQLITSGANVVGENRDAADEVQPDQSQYWGLGRVLGAEKPQFRFRLIDLPTPANSNGSTESLCELLLAETRDNQFTIRDEQFFVPRLKTVKSKKKTAFETRADSSYLITGGLGKLGRQAARWLARNGAAQVILTSRRAPDEATRAFIDEVVQEFDCDVVVHSGSLAQREDVAKLFSRFEDSSDLKKLAGVIHAAGLVDDDLFAQQNWSRFERVLAPKVTGATLLHEFTQSLDLDFFVLYSSVASVLGSRGQSNYATANAYLDGLAWKRHALGLCATSINWGPWTEGMADDEQILKRMKLQGITPLSVDEAHQAMEQILARDMVQATVLDVDWRRMQAGLGAHAPAMLDGLAPAKRKTQVGDSEFVSQLKKLKGAAQRELLVTTIQKSLQGILSTPDSPETDRPLIEMGLDSLMAVEFGTELQQRLGDQFAVGPTMLFDHPTIDAIADHVLELIATDSNESETPTAVKDEIANDQASGRVREDIAIIGMSCRFPGANNVSEFWQNLLNGVDSVGEIPSDRWDVDRFFSEDRQPGKMYTRQGGFLKDIADFDAAFFNIADQEACWIDPQHRMLLENSYHAMEDAGIPLAPLADSNVGVFMGIMGQDYAFIPTLDDEHIIKAFQGAGLSHSAGVGRISYAFGFEGPSVAVDTASSSSLVALMQAVRNLQDGNCNLALAGGVNAILVPVNSLLMSKAGLLSPDGRCKSFSAAANGFGRGEGCGVVVLKRLSDAQRDGDRIMAVVRGGAVVHNGTSSSITAPSGKSQARVIRQALTDARVAASQVQYLEAHGTGTEYGDPMELGAAAKVYGKGRKPDQPLLVGSVKANISHLEAAGGVSGLIKTVLSIHHGVIPPQANFDEPSPHIPWQRMPVKMVTDETPWPKQPEDQATDLRLAGLTALGLVGTNAHVILSSPPSPELTSMEDKSTVEPTISVSGDDSTDRPSELLVLSARNQAALKQMASELRAFLSANPETCLNELCHTTSAGRRHFEVRAATPIESIEDAIKKLEHLAESSAVSSTNGKPHFSIGPTESNGAAQSSGNGASKPNRLSNQSGDWFHGLAQQPPKIGWLFDDGTDSDFQEARQLYQTEPLFRQLMVEFDEVLAQDRESSESNEPTICASLELSEGPVAIGAVIHFALQAGLAKLLHAQGVSPDGVLGFGVGQYTAACVAGCLCFKDAIRLVHQRQKVLAAFKENSDSSNAPSQTSDESQLDAATKAALDEFEAFADSFNFYPPNLPLICSTDGCEVAVHRSPGGSYWRSHCLAGAKRDEAAETFAGFGCDYVLDLSAVGERSSGLQQVLSLKNTELIPVLRSIENPTTLLQSVLARLYVAGAKLDFSGEQRTLRPKRISLPPYPFQKKRYWITEVEKFSGDDSTAKKQLKAKTNQ